MSFWLRRPISTDPITMIFKSNATSTHTKQCYLSRVIRLFSKYDALYDKDISKSIVNDNVDPKQLKILTE